MMTDESAKAFLLGLLIENDCNPDALDHVARIPVVANESAADYHRRRKRQEANADQARCDTCGKFSAKLVERFMGSDKRASPSPNYVYECPSCSDYDPTTGTQKTRAQLEAEGLIPPADH